MDCGCFRKGLIAVGLATPLVLVGCGGGSSSGDGGSAELTMAETEEMAVALAVSAVDSVTGLIDGAEGLEEGPPEMEDGGDSEDSAGDVAAIASQDSGWGDVSCDPGGSLEVTSDEHYFELVADQCLVTSEGYGFTSEAFFDGRIELDQTLSPDEGYSEALHWTAEDFRTEMEMSGTTEMNFWMTFDGEYEAHMQSMTPGVEDSRLEVLRTVRNEFGTLCEGDEVRLTTEMGEGFAAKVEGAGGDSVDFTIDGMMSIAMYSAAASPTIDHVFNVDYTTIEALRYDDFEDPFPSAGELHQKGSAGGKSFDITLEFLSDQVCVSGATEMENRCYFHHELDEVADDGDDDGFGDDLFCAMDA